MKTFLRYLMTLVVFVGLPFQVLASVTAVNNQAAYGWFSRPVAKVAGVSGVAALVLIALCVKAHSDMKTAVAVHNEQRLPETRSASLKAQERFATLRKGVVKALGFTGLVLLYTWITRAGNTTKPSAAIQNSSLLTGGDAVVVPKPDTAAIDAQAAQKIEAEAAKKRAEDKAGEKAQEAARIEKDRLAKLEAAVAKKQAEDKAAADAAAAAEAKAREDAQALEALQAKAAKYKAERERVAEERRVEKDFNDRVERCKYNIEACGYKDLSVEERAGLFAGIDDAMLEKIPSGG